MALPFAEDAYWVSVVFGIGFLFRDLIWGILEIRIFLDFGDMDMVLVFGNLVLFGFRFYGAISIAIESTTGIGYSVRLLCLFFCLSGLCYAFLASFRYNSGSFGSL